MFTVEEIQKLTSIVDFHNSFFAVQILGKEVLDDYDKFVLKTYGIDVEKINNQGVTPYFQSLMWGRLSAMLTEKDAKDINYQDFEKYIKRGQYIPLSKEEQKRYEYSKQKTYTHLKGLGTKIKNDINNTLLNESEKSRAEYEKVIGDEIERGVLERKGAKSIISEIGHKTEVWNHDWTRIVETELNNVWQEGRAQIIEERQGKEALVFKDVFPGGCKSCIKLYTTDGIGSKPRVFKLIELQANGDNIGKKQADWLPIIGSTHPHCRCSLRQVPEGYEWNEENGRFELKKYEGRVHRTSKIKITIGDKVKFI